MELINNNNFDIIKSYFKNTKQCIIFGKGPTFEIKEKKDDEYFFCVNDTVNYIDKCDFLACNDIESFDNINLERLKNIKNILIPYHIHLKCKPNKLITYKDVIKKIEPYFFGNLIVYNLKSINLNYPEFINIDIFNTTSNTIVEFIIRYLKNIKEIHTYGIGIINKLAYNNFFLEQYKTQNKKSIVVYKNSKVISIGDEIKKRCANNNIKLEMY
jgi:hypothetical protein